MRVFLLVLMYEASTDRCRAGTRTAKGAQVEEDSEVAEVFDSQVSPHAREKDEELSARPISMGGAVRSDSKGPGNRLPTPVRRRVGPGTAVSTGRKPVAAPPLPAIKVGREVQEGQSPSWVGLQSNPTACERTRAGPFTCEARISEWHGPKQRTGRRSELQAPSNSLQLA